MNPRLRVLLEYTAVGIGGAMGALSRGYLFEMGMMNPLLLTGLINVAGTLLLIEWQRHRNSFPKAIFSFATTGFCGSFTTVSLLSLDLQAMLAEGQFAIAAAYTCLSVGGALGLGWLLAQRKQAA